MEAGIVLPEHFEDQEVEAKVPDVKVTIPQAIPGKLEVAEMGGFVTTTVAEMTTAKDGSKNGSASSFAQQSQA